MHSKLVILIDFLVLERVFYFTLNYHSGIGSPLSLQSQLQRQLRLLELADLRAEFEPLMFHYTPISCRSLCATPLILVNGSSDGVLTHASVTLGYTRQGIDMHFFLLSLSTLNSCVLTALQLTILDTMWLPNSYAELMKF